MHTTDHTPLTPEQIEAGENWAQHATDQWLAAHPGATDITGDMPDGYNYGTWAGTVELGGEPYELVVDGDSTTIRAVDSLQGIDLLTLDAEGTLRATNDTTDRTWVVASDITWREANVLAASAGLDPRNDLAGPDMAGAWR